MTGLKRTLCEVLDDRASNVSSKIAVKERSGEWSYGELFSRSEKFARCLTSVGISKGQRVGLMLPNSRAFVMAFLGIARAGGVVAPLNTRYQAQELSFYANDAEASAIVISADAVPRAMDVLRENQHPPTVIEVQIDGDFQVVDNGAAVAIANSDGNELPLLHQYTSGSTGTPKRVVRTHSQLLDELEQLANVFGLEDSDRFLGAAPFSHVNGMVRTMMSCMFVGGTLYPVPEFKRREILELITKEKITYFGAVPFMYAILADTPSRTEVDLSSLRIAFSSSAPLLPDDNRRFAERYGFIVRQLYGSTETGTITVNTDHNPELCLESVGLPLRGVRIEVVDEAGKICRDGQEGEIAIASPWGIKAYDNNPEANVKSFRDGYYLSGDLGFKDARGYVTLTGRKKFMINRVGYEVNPLEVEKAIRLHPKVNEVVVLGAPTPHGDQMIRCIVVAREPCKQEEILDYCRGQIADYKIPSIIEFADSLPKSPTGKILRHNL
jgi:long-chain acyl-CoA synthetase